MVQPVPSGATRFKNPSGEWDLKSYASMDYATKGPFLVNFTGNGVDLHDARGTSSITPWKGRKSSYRLVHLDVDGIQVDGKEVPVVVGKKLNDLIPIRESVACKINGKELECSKVDWKDMLPTDTEATNMVNEIDPTIDDAWSSASFPYHFFPFFGEVNAFVKDGKKMISRSIDTMKEDHVYDITINFPGKRIKSNITSVLKEEIKFASDSLKNKSLSNTFLPELAKMFMKTFSKEGAESFMDKKSEVQYRTFVERGTRYLLEDVNLPPRWSRSGSFSDKIEASLDDPYLFNPSKGFLMKWREGTLEKLIDKTWYSSTDDGGLVKKSMNHIERWEKKNPWFPATLAMRKAGLYDIYKNHDKDETVFNAAIIDLMGGLNCFLDSWEGRESIVGSMMREKDTGRMNFRGVQVEEVKRLEMLFPGKSKDQVIKSMENARREMCDLRKKHVKTKIVDYQGGISDQGMKELSEEYEEAVHRRLQET